jgi:Fur family ferric uptake transcriptional regulator
VDKQELHKLGLKATLPRINILQILEKAPKQHLSAEDIFHALLTNGEDIGLATIYRVLGQFEAAGLVIRHNFEDGYSVYELNQGDHHDHLVCIRCHKVEEFQDSLIEEQQNLIAAAAGYRITAHCLNIYGICSNCE